MALDPAAVLPTGGLSRPLRVAFFGTPQLAVPTLDALLTVPELCEVALVVAQPDRPAGRGRRLRPPPVAARAQDLGLTLMQPKRLRSGPFPEAFDALDLDLAVVIAYGRLLTTRLLEAPRYGCINVHASLLPAYRGAGPIQWAIVRGEDQTGVTTMWMEEGLDTGPVLLAEPTDIGDEETAGQLGSRLAGMGAALLVRTVGELHAGRLVATPQDEASASYAPLLTKADGCLDWSEAAVDLDRRIRGLSPWPGAFCGFRGEALKVHQASVEAAPPSRHAGEVEALGDGWLEVACGAGRLRLTRVQPPGRKAQDAADFVRGYRPQVGESLVWAQENAP